LTQPQRIIYQWTVQVSKQQIPTCNDEDLGLIATTDDGTYPGEVVLAACEELAAHDPQILLQRVRLKPWVVPPEFLRRPSMT
jgi:hypothetical protein